MNEDGTINVVDVIVLVNLVLENCQPDVSKLILELLQKKSSESTVIA